MTSTTTPAIRPAPNPAPELDGTAAEALCVLVAPSNGRFQPAVAEGEVARGGLVAEITAGGGRRSDVRSPATVVVRGLLARPGQLVTRGQALAWATKVLPA